jgi:hypothetical protein
MKNELNYNLSLKDLFTPKMLSALKAAESMDKKMSSISSKSMGAGLEGGMLRSVTAGNLLSQGIQRLGTEIWDFEKSSVQAFAKQEQFLVSLKTMFHGNLTEATLLNNQLKEFAKTTPFELTEIQDATKMMVAYGSNSSNVVGEMKMLGDVSSGVGSTLSEIGYLYGTLRTQGRAFSKDIYQFTGRGIPIVKELAKQFKVTDDKVMKLVEDGKVGFKDIEKAFKSMTSEGGQFFNMMNEQSKTLSGQTSNLADAWSQLKVSIGDSQSGILKDTVSWATDMVNAINAGINSINNAQSRMKKGGMNYDMGLGAKDFIDPTRLFQKKELAGMSNTLDAQMNVANRSLADAKAQQNLLNAQIKTLAQEFQGGKIDAREFSMKYAMLSGFQKELKDVVGIRQKNEGADLKEAERNKSSLMEDKKSSTGTKLSSTDISVARPQSIIINVNDGLVKEMTIQTTNLTEGSAKIKEAVAVALMEALNDANAMARS